jgi:hypothetical protein
MLPLKPPLPLKRLRPSKASCAVRLLLATGLALALAACGEEAARAPGAVSEGEAKALDAAASMLDERRLPPEAIPPETPTDEMTDDSDQPAEQ